MDGPRQAVDLYETAPEAVGMLLRHVPLRGPILEPSAERVFVPTAFSALHGAILLLVTHSMRQLRSGFPSGVPFGDN